jgi:hypothetical protein
MKKITALLSMLLLSLSVLSTEVAFIWDNENAPGIVAGYEFRWGTSPSGPGSFTQVKDLPQETPTRGEVVFTPGRYWIVVFAYAMNTNPDGSVYKLYSGPSNVLEIKVADRPVRLRIGL